MKKGAWVGIIYVWPSWWLWYSRLMPWGNMTSGHLGLLMLAMITIAIMMGFPTAFTLMGMGTLFAWLCLPQREPGYSGDERARPGGRARLCGDE